MLTIKLTVPFLMFFFSFLLFSQTETDSLNDIESIFENYYQNLDNPVLAKKYALEFKNKAQELKNDDYLSYGYLYLSNYSEGNKKLKYLDSIIYGTSRRLEQYPSNIFPEVAYYNKAYWYYKKRDFSAALEISIEGMDNANKNGKHDYKNIFKLLIGLVKSERINQEEDALKLVKEVNSYFENQSERNIESENYLSSLLALGDIYRKLGHTDSAAYFNNLGYKKAEKFNNTNYLNRFIFNQGLNEIKPKAAIDSIQSVINYFKDQNDIGNLSLSHYHLGKSYLKKENKKKALYHFNLMDSIVKENKVFNIELRTGFEYLINHYKNINDKSKQLSTIEDLMKLDSMYIHQYKNIRDLMDAKYDRKQIFKEREELIQELQKENEESNKVIILSSIIGFLLLGSTILYYRKQQVYKKRFDEVMNLESSEVTNLILDDKDDDIGVPNQIVDQILTNLSRFEEEEGFLNPKISSHVLAEKVDSNSKYLSKVINQHKQQSIIVYINNLRIDYAIKKLKEENKFRNYTIKAIAKEVGFNNPNSFSSAFEKKTKLKPSYFIKRIINASNS